MKSFKMKALALAVLGLGGLVLAGSAAAQSCTATNLNAWSGNIQNSGTVTVVAGGLETPASACSMQAVLTSSDPLASAAVYFSDPTNELSYHFRFYFNQDSIGTLSGFSNAQIFAAGSPNTFPATGLYAYGFQFQVGIIPGSGGNQLVAAVGCNNAAQQYVCLTTPIAISAGNHYVEGQVNVASGTAGFFKMWLDHNAAAATQPAPDASVLNIDNSEWGGVNSAGLGLGAASPGFTLNQPVKFDAFDSRRQTFIGP